MWFIFLKELRELRRDKKTLFFVVALPLLLFPMGIGAMLYFTGKMHQSASYESLSFTIVNEDIAPDMSSNLKSNEDFVFVGVNGESAAIKAIQDGDVNFVIVVPANFSKEITKNGPIKIDVLYSNAQHNVIPRRVHRAFAKYEQQVRETSMSKHGIDIAFQGAVLDPIQLNMVDVTDKRISWGEKIGGLIPYVIFILCLQGAMLPASDLGAGEKERGTLETLIICPVDRYQLVMGKFLTIAFVGVTVALVSVSSMAFWGIVFTKGVAVDIVAQFMSRIGMLDFVLIFLMLIPVVSIFAAALLSLSIYARSFKEAQSYMGPMMFVVIVPIIVATLPGVSLNAFWSWVPLTNVALAIKELIKGTMDYFALLGIFVSTLTIALSCITFSIFWFKKEKILYR